MLIQFTTKSGNKYNGNIEILPDDTYRVFTYANTTQKHYLPIKVNHLKELLNHTILNNSLTYEKMLSILKGNKEDIKRLESLRD